MAVYYKEIINRYNWIYLFMPFACSEMEVYPTCRCHTQACLFMHSVQACYSLFSIVNLCNTLRTANVLIEDKVLANFFGTNGGEQRRAERHRSSKVWSTRLQMLPTCEDGFILDAFRSTLRHF